MRSAANLTILRVFDWLRRLLGAKPPDLLAEIDAERARLIVGLGNPGPEYADTRHNLGFRTVEELARRWRVDWHKDPSSQSMLAIADDLLLAKPHTYMNRSGQAIRALQERLVLPRQRVLVVYDDMDLPFGLLRLRERGSPGTHNGMRSVLRELDSEDVPRLRIGISQAQPGAATDHVLSEFTPDQHDDVADLIRRAADAALAWAHEGAVVAMNRYNRG
jgi:peptidyl-tRNA hydrolase, PTH1 family